METTTEDTLRAELEAARAASVEAMQEIHAINRTLDRVRGIVDQATVVARHWRGQDGINAAELDKLAEAALGATTQERRRLAGKDWTTRQVNGRLGEVWLSLDGEVVILGVPAAAPGEEEDLTHNCDANGCGSVGYHVLWRGRIAQGVIAKAGEVVREYRARKADTTPVAFGALAVLLDELAEVSRG